jgi:hypothetical protein
MTSSRNLNAPIIDGTLLIEENTRLPEPSPGESLSFGNGWARIPNNLAFEKKLGAAGWTFFYMAGVLRATVLGFDRHRMIHNAVKRLLAAVALQGCNCLEVEHITMRSFCGMLSVTVLAHSRHVQQERFFFNARV